jgi:hypothetical protein
MPTKLSRTSFFACLSAFALMVGIFSGVFYTRLAAVYGPAVALALQQLVPIVLGAALFVAFRRYFSPLGLTKKDWIIIGVILIAATAAHALYLTHYFFKEDIAIEIAAAQNPFANVFPVSASRLYPLSLFSLLYWIVGANASVFALVGFLFHLANATLFYILIRSVSQRRVIAAGAALIWASSPAFLESFAWLGVGIGSGLAITTALVVLLLFSSSTKHDQPPANVPILFSIIILVAVNAGFVRTGILPFLLPLIIWMKTITDPDLKGMFWTLIKRNWLPITVGVAAVLYLLLPTINLGSGANVLGNRPLASSVFITTFFTITAALFPPAVQEFFTTQFAAVDGALKTTPWYAFHLIILGELFLPVVIILFTRDKTIRAIGMFGWLWFMASLAPMVIGGGAQDNYMDIYRSTVKFPYLPGIKQIHFAYFGYALAVSAALYVIFMFLKGKLRTTAFAVVIVLVTSFLAVSTWRSHSEFASYYSQPLKELVKMINARAPRGDEYLLVFAPHGSPVNSFLSGGEELKYITEPKKVLYSRDPQEAQMMIKTYRVKDENVLTVEYDPPTGLVWPVPFTLFREASAE